MIYTSSHNACNSSIMPTVAISGNRGKDCGYVGKCYPKLAPKLGFWKVWHDNIGVLSEEDNNYYYVEEYYKQVLSKLDPSEVYKDLDGSILLCYENNDKFCHRHIVAEWFQLTLGKDVPEVIIDDDNIRMVDRPNYVRMYLERAMEKNRTLIKSI